jgi:hypothetical protein
MPLKNEKFGENGAVEASLLKRETTQVTSEAQEGKPRAKSGCNTQTNSGANAGITFPRYNSSRDKPCCGCGDEVDWSPWAGSGRKQNKVNRKSLQPTAFPCYNADSGEGSAHCRIYIFVHLLVSASAPAKPNGC